MPNNIARDYMELLSVTKAANELDSIASLRMGLTAEEGEVVRKELDKYRSDLVRSLKDQVDTYFPSEGRDFVIASATIDAKRMRKPTGYIQPVGERDISRAVRLAPIMVDDNRTNRVWSFSARLEGDHEDKDTRVAIWDFDNSDDEGKWYCYGDVDIMRRLFGRRYVYTAN